MQPDKPNDYLENESKIPETDGIEEMYTPEPMPEEKADDVYTNRRQVVPDKNAPIHWEADEYINNEKNGAWFIGFSIFVLAFIALDIFILKSYTFSVLVLVMATAVVIMSRRPPRAVNYTLSGNQGLYIGERLYHFGEFKGFSIISDRGRNLIMLVPVKRFSPGVTFYFPTEAGEEIVDIVGARLPMENRKLDVIDIVVQKLRL